MKLFSAHVIAVLVLLASIAQAKSGAQPDHYTNRVVLYQQDFAHGTYIIDQPGFYQLGEDISFNPNSKRVLARMCEQTERLPTGFTCPADAYQAGMPMHTQLLSGSARPFTPGGIFDQRYDPAAFGLGFFAAIVINAPDVTLDLNGYTLEQSEEHALLQRFFALVELANMPFIPDQGPAGFGLKLQAAERVRVINGSLGRSAHHGIHGNGNRNVRVTNVEFRDYEVAALALNGVDGLHVSRVRARNRTDVPVLGTFSSAQFIKPYVEFLVRSGSTTRLNAQSALDIRDALRDSINLVHADLIERRTLKHGRPQIDADLHPEEFALFGNPTGFVDGNSYSFVVNPLGVAVNGFPHRPAIPARNIRFVDVHVDQQSGFVNEIIALASAGQAVIDPVGAVFQTQNRDQYGQPITTSTDGGYVGNVVADAQALVAKAAWAGEFADSRLDISRISITPEVLDWVEGRAATWTQDTQRFLCNGDSMFHVNKGVIAFKIDGAKNVHLQNTSAHNLTNQSGPGSEICGDYSHGKSHPAATLPGYGGARVRGYSFAGSENISLNRTIVSDASAAAGSAIGIDVMTDSRNLLARNTDIRDLRAGLAGPSNYFGPNETPRSVGISINSDVDHVLLRRACSNALFSLGEPAHLVSAAQTYPSPACSSWSSWGRRSGRSPWLQ
jgi:hypothetical protein